MTAVASAGFISISVDGRGTGFKGRGYRTAVSKRLGKLEVEDQVAAAKWLAGQEWVDEKRIGIWGWVSWFLWVLTGLSGRLLICVCL